LISLEGEQNGIVSLSEALEKAKNESLDLIEVDDKNGMPVCRIADFGKMKYRFNKNY
jgi:translation initiation factor IF-3